jgi:hypothetical protein
MWANFTAPAHIARGPRELGDRPMSQCRYATPSAVSGCIPPPPFITEVASKLERQVGSRGKSRFIAVTARFAANFPRVLLDRI